MSPGLETPRSSRRGNEQTRSKISDDGRVGETTRRDLTVGERLRKAFSPGSPRPGLPHTHTSNRVTLVNDRIQPPSSASPALMTSAQPTSRKRVWWAGETTGSGKVFFHNSSLREVPNLTSLKRCFRVRGTHDFETREHSLSVRVSWGKSMI